MVSVRAIVSFIIYPDKKQTNKQKSISVTTVNFLLIFYALYNINYEYLYSKQFTIRGFWQDVLASGYVLRHGFGSTAHCVS